MVSGTVHRLTALAPEKLERPGVSGRRQSVDHAVCVLPVLLDGPGVIQKLRLDPMDDVLDLLVYSVVALDLRAGYSRAVLGSTVLSRRKSSEEEAGSAHRMPILDTGCPDWYTVLVDRHDSRGTDSLQPPLMARLWFSDLQASETLPVSILGITYHAIHESF
jgi:hypothetical protein